MWFWFSLNVQLSCSACRKSLTNSRTSLKVKPCPPRRGRSLKGTNSIQLYFSNKIWGFSCRLRDLNKISVFQFFSGISGLRFCLFRGVFCSFWIPARGSVPGDYLTQASIQAVIRLHLTGALAGPPPHRAEARITQTLCLLRPAVHHAAGELVACHELAGVRLVGWGREENNDSVDSSLQARVTEEPEAEPHLAPLPKTDCRSQCRDAWRRRCRSLQARSGQPGWRYMAVACPASSCCSPPRCHSGSWGFPAAWTQSDWTADMAEAAGSENKSR